MGQLFRTVRTPYGERYLPADTGMVEPHFVKPPDTARLARQNQRILAMLRERPVTNTELAMVARKYTGRVSELRDYLRRRGWDIVARNRGGGVWEYRLERVKDGRGTEPSPTA